MAVWANFVQCQLNTGISNVATSMIVDAAPSGWNDVPDPAGDIALLTLLDDIDNPTVFEIISYTGRTGSGPFTLTGLARGVEGTTAVAWTANSYIVQNITAGEIGGASGTDYVRATPMDITVGGATAGTTFDGTVQDALDTVLYPYIAPAFTSFSLTGYSTLEVGDSVPAGSQTFTFNIDEDGNVQTNSIDIENVSDSVTLATGTANDNTETVTFPSPVTRTTSGSKTFRITGTNTQASDFTRNLSINWRFRVYYGESVSTSLNEAGIEALRASLLASGASRTYAMLGGGYKYLCWPSSFSQPTQFKDANSGFAVAMESPVTVSVTNAHGVTTDYSVYRTTNQLAGAIDIEVS